MGAIVHPYVKDVPGPQMAGLSQLLEECTKQPLGLSTGSVKVFQDLCKETIGVAGWLALLRAAVQQLLYCGWRWHLRDSRFKRTPFAALQVQQENRNGR